MYTYTQGGLGTIVGVAAEVKPLPAPANHVFIELDTGKSFNAVAAAWVEVIPPTVNAVTSAELTAAVAPKVDATDGRLSNARPPTAHSHVEGDVSGLTAALAGKAASGHTHTGFEAANANIQAHVTSTHAPSNATVNSSDAALLSRANHTGTQSAATISDPNTIVPNAHYRTILESAGSHIAARVAGTYAIPMGEPLAISGTGTLYPLNTIYIAAADYPTVNGLAAKLRIRVQLFTNDTAPTGNYTIGLYPITRPATSGGAGLCIFTLGTVVAGSNGAVFTTPAADGLLQAVGADFALPADGHYVLGVVTTATVATSALVHVVAKLQMRNA